jgi:hypothetical protein
MTESIAQIERAQAAEQAVARAVQNLQRAGYEDASPEAVEFLTQNFEPLQKMRGLLKTYGDTSNTITDNIDADDEERIQAYAELRNHVVPQYEEAAQQLNAEILARRQQYHTDVFGIPELSSPTATPSDRNTAAMNYRDALYRLQGATPEDLDNAGALAEAAGDTAMLRAVGLVADRRGDLANVHRYLKHAGEKTRERYILRNMLPTETTVGSLISGFEPPRIPRGALAPSQIVLEARRRQEAQREARNAGMFRG